MQLIVRDEAINRSSLVLEARAEGLILARRWAAGTAYTDEDVERARRLQAAEAAEVARRCASRTAAEAAAHAAAYAAACAARRLRFAEENRRVWALQGRRAALAGVAADEALQREKIGGAAEAAVNAVVAVLWAAAPPACSLPAVLTAESSAAREDTAAVEAAARAVLCAEYAAALQSLAPLAVSAGPVEAVGAADAAPPPVEVLSHEERRRSSAAAALAALRAEAHEREAAAARDATAVAHRQRIARLSSVDASANRLFVEAAR